MKTLFRTAEGAFVRDGAEVFALGPITDSELADAVARLSPALIGLESAAGVPRLPVTPTRIVLVGLNYASHAAEIGAPAPTQLMFGAVPAAAAAPHGSEVSRPPSAPDQVDYEGEVGIVIGRAAANVSPAEAAGVVLGLTPVIDVSARDLQVAALAAKDQGPTIAESKSFPNFKPFGPEILLTEGRPLEGFDLSLETRVNGETRQRGRTSELIFSLAEVVSTISRKIPLQAGDLICSGTPAGVGFASKRFLQAGDRVEVTLETLPTLSITLA